MVWEETDLLLGVGGNKSVESEGLFQNAFSLLLLSTNEIEDSEIPYSLSCSFPYKEVCNFYKHISSFLMDMRKRNRHDVIWQFVTCDLYLLEEQLQLCVFSHQGDIDLWQVNVFLCTFTVVMIGEKCLSLLKRTFKL